MKISYNWLLSYVPHGLSPDALAEALTMSGLEVEEVTETGSRLDGVVVGKVLSAERHPNADRLTICRVDVGEENALQIICGAPNVAEGQKVAVATLGTVLMLSSRESDSDRVPVVMEARKIRGERSEGMICAEDELGLSDDHSGIMVLQPEAVVGLPLQRYLSERGMESGDAVLDVNITPNRPDATSHLGVARDVSALTDILCARPEVELPDEDGEISERLSIQIEDPEGCARYVGMLVRGVRVQESPTWLKQRLTAVGLRPRNNIVDVTNFVMYECGQPLHAFDFDRIAGGRIVVRTSRANESFTTLDSKSRALAEGTLLICDAEQPVAIAGVMGGENSEVTDETVNVLIESAYFDPSMVRKSARALGLATDASYRFERGVDTEVQLWAAARAAEMIAKLSGGEVVRGAVDARPRPIARAQVRLRLARVSELLGIAITQEEVERILTALGFEIEADDALERMAERMMEGRPADGPSEPALLLTVPSFRPDITREVDVIEEIARIYGYDRIAEKPRSALPNRTPSRDEAGALRSRLRGLLSASGYREIYTNSMLRRDVAATFAREELGGSASGEAVETLNPISSEMAALRPSLLPGALSVAAYNASHGQRALNFFELGHVFRRSDKKTHLVPGYAEHEALILLSSGPREAVSWQQASTDADFFSLKGTVQALLNALHLDGCTWEANAPATPVSDYYASLSCGGVALGSLGRVAEEQVAALGLKDAVFFAELNFDSLLALARSQGVRQYQAISRFPVVERDLALVVAQDVTAGAIIDLIKREGAPLVQQVDVFDLYEGKGVPEGKKSIAFSLRLGADRTLQDAETDAVVERVTASAERAFGAKLRA